LSWNGAAFTWAAAPAATTATALAGGTAGVIPYQSATSTTGFTAAGTTGQLLQSTGTTAPVWVDPALTPGLILFNLGII
jgi:hypothetical protein